MKLSIAKRIENGEYHVAIRTSDFNQSEVENIKKFGSPKVSISPEKVFRAQSGFVYDLLLHDIDDDFIFPNTIEAQSFEVEMTSRIKIALELLKSYRDDFSGVDEIDL
jgi:hypothetical protein